MKTTSEIKDYQEYTSKMTKSMLDKAFFLDKVDTTNIVDFGCADGRLLKFISGMVSPESLLIGYDSDSKMLAQAKTNFKKGWYFEQWYDKTFQGLIKSKREFALVCSSLIHEVYHYSSKSQIDDFWDKIFDGNFKYIVIRDMMPNRSIDRPSDINDIAKLYQAFLHQQALRDFETTWGSIENNKHLVHFLLKCKYLKPNWEREVKENYIPLYREDFLALLDLKRYEIIYHEHYILPYIKQYCKDDYGIELKDPTHMKIILKRK